MAEPQARNDAQLSAQVSKLEELLERLQAMSGPGIDVAMEAIEALTQVYGAALATVVATLGPGSAGVRELADDDLVGHLLMLHGLHPDPPQVRIARALDDVRTEVGEKAQVRLSGIEDGVARIEVTATGCQSTAAAVSNAVADVVIDAAPDLAGVDSVRIRPPAAPPLIPLDSLRRRPAAT